MKAICLIFFIAAVEGTRKKGLRVTFGVGTKFGTDFLFEIPKTIDEVETQGWDAVEKPEGLPYSSLDMYCSDDRIMCGLFDNTQNVAGLQIAVPLDDAENVVFDWAVRGYKFWETEVEGEVKQFYTIQQYFIAEENLSKSVEERMSSWNANKTLQEDAIWATSINGSLLRIPISTEEIASSGFTKQGCMTWMGQHYNYKLDEETECLADTLAPWFTVVDGGELVATGYAGYYTLKNSYKWFEIPTRALAENNFPHAPECLYELTENPGTVSIHIFYIDEPWNIDCPTE